MATSLPLRGLATWLRFRGVFIVSEGSNGVFLLENMDKTKSYD